MTRVTQLNLKLANQAHLVNLAEFVAEYRRVTQLVVERLWSEASLPRYIDARKLGLNLNTWLSARATWAISKQALELIEATRKSRQALRNVETARPDASKISPRLDSRFWKIDWNSNTSFDGWLTLGCLGRKLRPRFPLKKTAHFNKLAASGRQLNSIIIKNGRVILVFELPDRPAARGDTVGLDIGIASPTTIGRSHEVPVHPHGWTHSRILTRLSRRKKGSRNFRQAQALRLNFTNWWINRLNLAGIGLLKLENIYHIRHRRKVDRFRGHWSYPQIYRKLESRCEEFGVQVQYINQAYTSQECSSCGAVDRRSRRGSEFECTSCACIMDADLNAALNIGRRPILQAGRGVYRPSRNQSGLLANP